MKTILFPGQGAQYKGMGRDLFPAYREYTKKASEILGYSIEALCVDDAENKLRLTQYTQPALYVVNALGYFKKQEESGFEADFFAGHSLGEYNALLAAGSFSFETGLRLVKKRGELMGAAQGGTMAAVLGVNPDEIRRTLADGKLSNIDLANFNTPHQTVIAGPRDAIEAADELFNSRGMRCVLLNVSAPFHSRYMQEAQEIYQSFLRQFEFRPPSKPVVSNVTARPHGDTTVAQLLAQQISMPVLWTESVRYLMGRNCKQFLEIGGNVLSKMVAEIEKLETPLVVADHAAPPAPPSSTEMRAAKAAAPASAPYTPARPAPIPASTMPATTVTAPVGQAPLPQISPGALGSPLFRSRFGLKYAYASGAMYRGIASPKLVVRMGKAGLIGFFGTGGLSLKETEDGILFIQKELRNGEAYGANLLADYANPAREMDVVKLYLKYKVRNIEAAAFMQMTAALVLFRLKGLRRGAGQAVLSENRIIAKVSRPEVAEIFMSPPPPAIVQELLESGQVTSEQAELSKLIPMSQDICIEADSGGHTDGGIPTVLFPAMSRLRHGMERKYSYKEPICMGLAGGIGTPEAAAAAFLMGADFIVTGSINQCTVDAGTSDAAKSLLQDINIQDTEYAPAGDMFEVGAKVQVLRKGVFFPTRANKLHALYSHYGSLDEIPEKTRTQLEVNYFKKTFDEIWSETKSYLLSQGQGSEISKADSNPKHKMALVFRWYFAYSTRIAMKGDVQDRVNYQVHTGPALGAFNQWVKGTPLESWKHRHADEIGIRLLTETAVYITKNLHRMCNPGLGGPFDHATLDNTERRSPST